MQSSSLQQQVKMLLDAYPEVHNEFFESNMPASVEEIKSWHDDDYFTNFLQDVEKLNIRFYHEDNFGGEGEGEDYWSVYRFATGTEQVYVQFQGWYQSYNGSEFSEWFFVEPREVQVTQYFRV